MPWFPIETLPIAKIRFLNLWEGLLVQATLWSTAVSEWVVNGVLDVLKMQGHLPTWENRLCPVTHLHIKTNGLGWHDFNIYWIFRNATFAPINYEKIVLYLGQQFPVSFHLTGKLHYQQQHPSVYLSHPQNMLMAFGGLHLQLSHF